MDVTPYIAALRDDLLAAAAAGDEHTQRTAALLATALEPSARLALLNALVDMAGEVTEALDGGRTVEVRLDGRQVRVVLTEPPGSEPSDQPPPAPPPGAEGAAGDVSRITLRMMEQLKSHAEQMANSQGMSLNSWISQAVQGALYGSGADPGRGRGRGRPRDQERRLRGWVQG